MNAMNAWSKVEEEVVRKDAENSVWIKMPKSGDKVVVVLRGEPYLRESCFHDGAIVPLEEAKKRKLKIRTSVAFNVVVWPSREVKVLEKSTSFFKDLLIVVKKYGLDKWAFEITRRGEGLKTEHSILPEVALTAEDRFDLDKLPLHDLEKLYAGESGDTKGGPTGPVTEDEFPSAPATVTEGDYSEIMARLKGLPRDYIDRFLNIMGVVRVREIDVVNIPRALTYISALKNEFDADTDFPHGANVQEADPYA